MHSVLVQDFVSSQACYKSQYHYKYTHYMQCVGIRLYQVEPVIRASITTSHDSDK